ncbi:MAG: excinuclease ABC subunit UvrB [Armatimonadetes bacterium]|nr:excinuclease ABC subunit UvrB [Armatimonadota bacterium]
MPDFKLVADFQPTGDQPQAIDQLTAGLEAGQRYQTLLGVTGSGKTFTMASVIERVQRPTLVLAPNRTLAAQLCSEFKEFFPENAVAYFVSYYDYYQPEAYLPRTDTYIAKDADINDEIDKLRHAATRALFERRDVLIVASVSCIYGLGEPEEYQSFVITFKKGETFDRSRAMRRLVDMQYERNDMNLVRGKFRIRGDSLTIQPSYEELAVRIDFFGDEVERILEIDPLTGELLAEREQIDIYPAKHFVTSEDKLEAAIADIEAEMIERVQELKSLDRILEAARLEERTRYDLETMRETGYCSGIENYSRHLARREAGSRPWTLLDYFPDDWLLFIDESHIAVPQVRGMYHGDISRKQTLVDYGFRLPSALDNRPLNFAEFEQHIRQAIFTTATPGPYEYEVSSQIVEQLIRPTALLDPTIEVKPTEHQVDDLMDEINTRVDRHERVLVTTLTKKMAEDLTGYLQDINIKVQYLHSGVHSLERPEILRDLRLGIHDVVVGVNLLREGLDLPEVTLVAILDADKEGFLRSDTSLIQTIGRAARNVGGRVLMYADKITGSMQRAIEETDRRRAIQQRFNEERGTAPKTVTKAVRETVRSYAFVAEDTAEYDGKQPRKGKGDTLLLEDIPVEIARLENTMKDFAKELRFEDAAKVRDEVFELRRIAGLADNAGRHIRRPRKGKDARKGRTSRAQ